MKILRNLLFAAVLILLPQAASASCNGQAPPGYGCGNNTATNPNDPHLATFTSLWDLGFSATQGNIFNRQGAGWVATPTPFLGVAGSVLGTLGFNNVTSGTITVSPPAGALGTVTNTLQAANDTFVYKATADALTNKTYNGLNVTVTTGTLTIASLKTLTINNSLTFAGTDGTTMTFPGASTTVAGLGTTQTFSGNNTFSGQLIETGTTAPASAAQTVVLGTIAAPSLTTTGQAYLYNTVANGAVLQGDGSTNDVTIANKGGTSVCTIATGVTTLNCTTLTLTNPLAIGQGGTGSATASAAATAIFPVAVRTGDVPVWGGSSWTTLAGNNSGTQVLSETSAGAAAWSNFVVSYNTRTGAVVPAAGDYTLNQIFNCTLNPQGRLTLSTGTPVMTATVSGATSIFYTPYFGQQVPIYDGTRFNCVDTGGELSQLATDASKSPAATAANSCYDIFVWSDSGTIRATRGTVWTNTTTRAQALSRIKGIYTNGTAITNGPGLNLGTYVGTACSNGSSTFDWILGAPASGGTAASLNIWNEYNRVDYSTQVTDNGVSYTYATSTIRQARASAGNQVSIVSGNPEDSIEATYASANITSATLGDGFLVGVGLDSTTTFTQQPMSLLPATAATQTASQVGAWTFQPQTGRHVISANENVNAAVASTFDNSSTNVLSVKFRM